MGVQISESSIQFSMKDPWHRRQHCLPIIHTPLSLHTAFISELWQQKKLVSHIEQQCALVCDRIHCGGEEDWAPHTTSRKHDCFHLSNFKILYISIIIITKADKTPEIQYQFGGFVFMKTMSGEPDAETNNTALLTILFYFFESSLSCIYKFVL